MDNQIGLDMTVALALTRLRHDYEIDVAKKTNDELAEGILQIDMPTCVMSIRMAADGDYDLARKTVAKSVARALKRPETAEIEPSGVVQLDAVDNVDYSGRAMFVAKVESQISRYRNIALAYRYGGRREDED